MELRRVPPDDIVIPEVRVTAKFSDEMWEQFKSSMGEVGQIAPIICIEVDGVLHLVDGLHRLVEAKNQGVEAIDVAVIPGDEADILTKNLFIDHLRGKPPVTDMIKVIAELTANYQLDSEQISAKTGLTRDYVEKLQKLSELTPQCLAALDEGTIGVGQAAELTRLPDPVKQEAVLYQLLLYRWGIKELRDYINGILELLKRPEEPTPEEARREPPKIRCFYCHLDHELTEIANPNTCRECSLTLLTAIAQASAELAAEQKPKDEPPGG